MKQPKDYIIFPLDVPTKKEALRFVDLLKDDVGLFKVGLELFISQGPDILRAINETAGNKLFLDLKLHDIPATVTRAYKIASSHAPEFLTIHCDAADMGLVEAAKNIGGKTKILAVTLLTSLNAGHIATMGFREEYVGNLSDLVLLRARIAREAGCQGIVCSGHEVAGVKGAFPDLIAVTPGIRPAWSLVEGDDQKRIVTPERALRDGSDYIVIGRPIRDAADPREAAGRVAEEIENAFGAAP